MTHLEQVHCSRPVPHLGLCRKAGITSEKGLEGAVLNQKDERVFVDVLAPSIPVLIGVQNGEHDAVQNETLITAGNVPPDATGSELIEKGIVKRVAHPLTWLHYHLSVEPTQHTGNATEMVGVRVGDDHKRKLARSLFGQERNDHPTTGVSLTSPWARVDEDPAPGRCPQDGTVSLADVEKM